MLGCVTAAGDTIIPGPIARTIAAAGGGGVVIDSVTSTFKNGDTSLTISGSGFGASQGAGLVRISQTNDINYTTSFAPVFRSISTVATVANGNLTNNAPSGGAQNDIYICFISSRSNAVWTAPTGGEWTEIAQDSSGNNSTTTSSSIASGAMWWCRRGASDPNFVWTRTGGDVASGYILAYAGCIESGSPIDTYSISNAAANTTTITTASLTSTVRNTKIVMAFAGADNTTASTWYGATGPYQLAERVDANTSTGSDTTLAIADWEWPPAQATGLLQLTAGNSSRHTAMALALKPKTYDPIQQTVTAWSDTSITFTAVRTNGLDRGTRYVFVSNNSSQTNASGYAVTMTGTVRYVDAASTAGGDGTTTNTAGATRAFASLSEALYAAPTTLTDIWDVHCVGSSIDTNNVDHGPMDGVYLNTHRDNYLYVEGNNTSGKWNTSAYRMEYTNGPGVYNNGPSHVRFKNLQIAVTISGSSGSHMAYRLSTANVLSNDCDMRIEGCIAKLNYISGTGSASGFENSVFGGQGTITIFNCISQGDGDNTGFKTDGVVIAAHLNCTAYGGQYGFQDQSICVNSMAISNVVDFVGGSATYINRNNCSSDGSAIGSNEKTGGPSFVSTSGTFDLHLNSGDTVAKDFGVSDPGFGLFNYDIDGVAPTGSWSIGVDDP